MGDLGFATTLIIRENRASDEFLSGSSHYTVQPIHTVVHRKLAIKF